MTTTAVDSAYEARPVKRIRATKAEMEARRRDLLRLAEESERDLLYRLAGTVTS